MPAIETPCIKICVVPPLSQHCIGCGRSLDEIASWSTLTEEQRRCIMDGLPQRLQTLHQRPASPSSLA